tara:strand:+ start:2303 stop:2533 length:231 start_codon:yes stop_codon:yes gene_type:complete
MRLTESQLRNLTRKIISELFTKKNPFSAENTLDHGGRYFGSDYDSFGYDEIGFDDGFAEGDESELDELREDEEEVE